MFGLIITIFSIMLFAVLIYLCNKYGHFPCDNCPKREQCEKEYIEHGIINCPKIEKEE